MLSGNQYIGLNLAGALVVTTALALSVKTKAPGACLMLAFDASVHALSAAVEYYDPKGYVSNSTAKVANGFRAGAAMLFFNPTSIAKGASDIFDIGLHAYNAYHHHQNEPAHKTDEADDKTSAVSNKR